MAEHGLSHGALTMAAAARTIALIALVISIAVPVAAQTAAPSPSTPSTEQELAEEADEAAPVTISGETILWIPAGAGQYTPQVRAERIAERIEEAIVDRTIATPTVTVIDVEGSPEPLTFAIASAAEVPDIVSRLVGEGKRITRVVTDDRSLEAAYLDLVEERR